MWAIIGIIDKVMAWFTPQQVKQNQKIRLAKLKAEKKELMKLKPTPKLAKKLQKIEEKIKDLERKLNV